MLRRLLVFGFVFAAVLLSVGGIAVFRVVSSIRREAYAVRVKAEQHLADHRDQLGGAVARVISSHVPNSEFDVSALPVELQIPGLRHAIVRSDHVTLITYSDPDTSHGYRIWRGDQSVMFDDVATSIPGVYEFDYCNDYPESRKNQPD